MTVWKNRMNTNREYIHSLSRAYVALTIIGDTTLAPKDPICIDGRLICDTTDIEGIDRVGTNDALYRMSQC